MSRQNNFSRGGSCFLALGGILASLLFTGCGSKEVGAAAPAATPGSSAKPAAASAPAPAEAAPATTNRPPQFVSVFSTTDPKDPFNPKIKPKGATSNSAPVVSTVGPQDIAAALEAGFTGTFGAPGERIALIHGLTLEQNRDVSVPITVQGSPRRVKVRPVRILRDAMEAQVEGVPNVVTLKVRR